MSRSRRHSDPHGMQERHDKEKERGDKSTNIIQGLLWSLFANVITIIHMIVHWVLEQGLELYWQDRQTCPPLANNPFLMKSAVELASMIRKRQITSTEVVKGYIDRIIEVNPTINAIIDGPFMDALEEAKEVDRKIEKGQISEDEFAEKPFMGVPFTTKDSTAVKDRLQTLGLVARRNFHAKEDADCIRLMKESGAIIIATTSVPEVNRWQETRNNIIGNTNNPYDTRRTAGGSSGGEASLISSCGSAIGIGTDIGGSIRMPAYFCGVFGHKPTPGLINTKGCTMRTGKEQSTMVVAGPITRTAADLSAVFHVLVGPENCARLQLDKTVDVKKLKYYYLRSLSDLKCGPVCADLKRTMSKATHYLSSISGVPAKEIKLSGLNKMSKLWRFWMTQEPSNFNLLLGNGVKLNPLIELKNKLMGTSDYTLASIFSLIDSLLPAGDAEELRKTTETCANELERILGDDGVLISHSYTHAATFTYAPLVQIYNFTYWSMFNVLKVPATQVPMGLNSKGLPLGIQVVATKNRDRDTLAVAAELEKEFGGWVPPFEKHIIDDIPSFL